MVIEKYELNEHQLYNADETGLYWQLLPDKTYVSLAEKTAPGLKMAKRRVTFLGRANASGSHKIKPLLIGTAKNPRRFKNFHNPLVYRHTKNAWMTGELFKNWFFQQFVPEVKSFLRSQNLPEKAVLLLDNAPSHPPAADLKSSDGEALQKITLRDAVIHLMAAWEKINPEMISKCWRNILEFTDASDEDDLPLSRIRQQLIEERAADPIRDTIALLGAIGPTEYAAVDIEEWNKDSMIEEASLEETENMDSNESDIEIEEKPVITIKHSEAVQALAVSLEWAKQNSINLSNITTLKNIHEKAVLAKLSAKQTQSQITSYFRTNN